jgi:tRNA (mo5U34)-methyltransferase
LKNRFYALEFLAKSARYLVLSTRIARHFSTGGPDESSVSAAYLVDVAELNNDATNYWIFTAAGLKRIAKRAGWDIIRFTSVGDTTASNPQDADHDERVFCTMRSRHHSTAGGGSR